MRTDAIVPISPEVAERFEQARLTSAFDALYEAGGLAACLRIITILTERLAQRLRDEAERIRAGQAGGQA